MSAIDKKFQSKNFKNWSNSDLKNIPVDGKRYNSYEFMEKEWEYMWPKVWLLLGREEEIPNAGDYQMEDFGKESFLMVRQDDGCWRTNI